MSRKKIVLQSNSPHLKTGLGETLRFLFKYLYSTQKYDLVLYCSQINQADPAIHSMPVKAYGAIPNDQNIINQINQDPLKARSVAYGSFFIDDLINKECPQIWWEADDIWSTQLSEYMEKPWYKQVHPVLYKTIDSLPILDDAFKQAKTTPNYYTWAKFFADEMRKAGPEYSHVKHIFPPFDTNVFSPISKREKLELRKRFDISEDTYIFVTINRNQLRKNFVNQIDALARFKKINPGVKAKLHFHTSFSESGQGWDIKKMAKFYGLEDDDILCTYVCKNCGNWHVRSFDTENIDCPYCGAQKSMITSNIVVGVDDSEMKYLIGMADGGLSCFTSGGSERFSTASLLCGLPTAITNYACGCDFAEAPGVTPINWSPYYEPGTNFLKSSSNPNDIVKFMTKVVKAKEFDKEKTRQESRNWAIENFAPEVVGAQWEKLFDSLPPKDWESVTLTSKPKNDKYPMPADVDDSTFVLLLYENILFLNETSQGEGFRHWMEKLKGGVSRQQIYDFFIATAAQENAKNQPAAKLDDLFEPEIDKKKVALVLPRSIGDIVCVTALLESYRETYPSSEWRRYFITEEKYFEILEPLVPDYIDKLIPYRQEFDNQLLMEGQADHKGFVTVCKYLHFPTQKILNYLNNGEDKIAFDIERSVVSTS